MSSEVKANKISPATGTTTTLGDASDVFQLPASAEIDIASGATLDINGTADFTGATVTGLSAGKVLQVVSSHKSDTATTTSAIFVTTGLEVTITPSATSSKILIIATPSISGLGGTNGWGSCLLRDTTELNLGNVDSNLTRYGVAGRNDAQYSTLVMGMTYLDSPSSTSSITYKVAFRNGSGSYSLYLNRPYTRVDNTSYGTASSTITVMEIEG